LDGLDALIFFSSRGVQPARIFQYIAIALFGPGTSRGGGKTLAIGILLHFCVATLISLVFVLAAYLRPVLLRHPVIFGMWYGITAYFVMQYIVVPLFIHSAGDRSPWPVAMNGIVGHGLLVGLPIALITRWTARQR
jgi:hypothetical protein